MNFEWSLSALILEKIQTPADIKKLSLPEAKQLCDELRAFLVERVSRTGGHLAGNLGVVELTVAIHMVFDTAKDRLVFDVGHQCYVHKALTGRQSLFDTLRQYGGLSGFPKPYESEHDAFIAGHASNSVSVALGMARARSLLGENYHVLAMIGDGAMGGGLSFEGLNDAGSSQIPMIVILNDNGMSIDPNVGAMSRHLSGIRSTPTYYRFKRWMRQKLQDTALYGVSHDLKISLKKTLLPGSTVFENMGFAYMGPVDGHDLEKLVNMLTWAKEKTRPVLLHVHTQKGRGYEPAMREPEKFHGVSPFDPATGEPLKPAGNTFSDEFGRALTALADSDPRICAITAAMESGTGLSGFAKAHPDRFFNVGIAEGHAVSMAGGLAKQGMIPVFAVYSSFLQRSYDMLIHDVSLGNLHVVLAVDRAGLVGADGQTHHGCFDPQYLSQIPGMTVLCPANFAELNFMLARAVKDLTGPVAVRYPRGGEGRYADCCGTDAVTWLRRGPDFTIVTYGILVNQALEAADLLEKKGIHIGICKLNQIAPLEFSGVAESLGDCKRLLVLEDCVEEGCVGQRIAAATLRCGIQLEKLILKNCGMELPCEGTVQQLYQQLGLDAQSLSVAIEEVLGEQ